MSSFDSLMRAAEAEWLAGWAAGPTEDDVPLLPGGTAAPDLELDDDVGNSRMLAEFWADGPALVMFWRHFGCGCGIARAQRLKAEWLIYEEAGLTAVIVAQGEPERAAAYRAEHALTCRVLCDPDHRAYRAYGVGHWPLERIMYDAPPELWSHEPEAGARLQASGRADGRPPVDDPWRAAAEFVVGTNGIVRLSYAYQYCEDYPDARVLATAAKLS